MTTTGMVAAGLGGHALSGQAKRRAQDERSKVAHAVPACHVSHATARVPLQVGYFVQPQNCDPALLPFLAVRFTISEPQLGQAALCIVGAAAARTGCGAVGGTAASESRACLIRPNSSGPGDRCTLPFVDGLLQSVRL